MPIAAVVKSHHAFDNSNVGVLTCPRERIEQLSVAQHPGIEIPARSAGRSFVIARVDVVRTALERLDYQTPLTKRGDQTRGDCGLTYVGRSARDNNPRCFRCRFQRHLVTRRARRAALPLRQAAQTALRFKTQYPPAPEPSCASADA